MALKKLNADVAGGLILLAAAALALVVNNSPLASLYDQLLGAVAAVRIGDFALEKPVLLWINDGLMAVFFLLVGLEIKREFLEGALSSVRHATLPALAAVGGMVVPAVVFTLLNWGDATAMRGWAIPAATDIAFAIGILALLGPRVPIALKAFLLALATLDDLGAIIIIALFYTAELSLLSLALAAAGTLVLILFNRLGVTRTSPYVLVGIFIWICVLKSGVHATLAGVVVALCIPMHRENRYAASPLKVLEHGLHPYVMLGIMPVFAFANAGVSLTGIGLQDLMAPLPLGIALGLFVGKQVGIMGISLLAVRLGLCNLPHGVTTMHLYGASLLAGIGFTMSLFIGTLAFATPDHLAAVRIGVLSGSLLSAVLGYAILRTAHKKTD